MDKKIMQWSTYEAPSLKTLDIQSEGVLCGSFDADNHTEKFNYLDMEEL